MYYSESSLTWDTRRAVSLTYLFSIIVGIVCSVLTPYMLNPGAWNWRNYAGFFWVSKPPFVFLRYPWRSEELVCPVQGLTSSTGRDMLLVHRLHVFSGA